MTSEVLERVLAVMQENTARLKPPPCVEEPPAKVIQFTIVKLPDRASVVSKPKRTNYRGRTWDKRCRGQKPRYKERRRRYVALGRVVAELELELE